MKRHRPDGSREADEVGRDMELAELLAGLDPATADPSYWLRFRSWVLTRASGELARRRLMQDLTMADVLASWSRAVVPAAMVAAVLAAVALTRTAGVQRPAQVGIEELLVAGLEDDAIPTALARDEASGSPVFASETF
ncbi:MAG TPA: hypothetical protein VK849_13285 [Longimicrobiales bacterium]|nr:hypothetical protein [Longimicrobiales bacterium]